MIRKTESKIDKRSPEESKFSMPAEWYPHSGCWMGWPCHLPTWKSIGLYRARVAYARVALSISTFEPVTIFVNPGDEELALELCGPGIRLITFPMNDSWLRDTGPSFLLDENKQLAGVNWIHNAWGELYTPYDLDNEIAGEVLKIVGARRFDAPIVMEGGSFHVDGEGTLITTRECLLNKNRNPHLSETEIESYLKKYLGVEKIIWLNKGLVGDCTDGHVDEIACFISPGKVLCLIENDVSDINYERLQENFSILQNSRDAKGRLLEVVPIEQPPASYLDGERLTLSYINFYLANGGIVMPAFGCKEHDAAAKEVLEKQFPDRSVVQIDAFDVFAGGGGIHCITQQQPVSVP